jgi:hypothetical protein
MDGALQKELFDLTKTVIERLSSAPVVLLVFILLFKNQLKDVLKSVSEPFGRVVESFLSRGFKLGVSTRGLSLEAAEVAAAAQEKTPPFSATGLVAIEAERPSAIVKDDADTERLRAVKNFDVPPIALMQEDAIRADLGKLGIGQEEQIGLLVKHLAVTQLWLRAEMTYRTIFGSQIALLKVLNTTGSGTKAQVLAFYENAKAQFGNLYAGYSFEQYLNYLVSQGLITAQDPERYIITVAGKEFLKWLTERGIVENKPF